MIIVGIDPAISVTGYGVIGLEKNKPYLIEAGIVSTSTKQDLPMRLNKIYKAVTKLISDTKPQIVVLEKIYAHYRHPTTAYALGQARGVICLAVAQKNIPLVEYAATRIKKSIVGMGHASKSQVQKAVANILNLQTLPKYADVTDALALAIAHSHIARPILLRKDNRNICFASQENPPRKRFLVSKKSIPVILAKKNKCGPFDLYPQKHYKSLKGIQG